MREAEEAVAPILEDVRRRGDAALCDYARRFDGFTGSSFLAQPEALAAALERVAPEFVEAVETARTAIEAFARAQMPREFTLEPAPGHEVGQIVRPVETAAAYVPAGRYPLPSTLLMTCVPALVAGVPNLWVASPRTVVETDAVAALLGVRNVARLGGAHAIAGFAFGTETLPKADRIVGPGNVYVAAAKKLLAGEVGIEFVAGPTEVMIVAFDGNPAWIAADLLAQAEHDPDAAAILVTDSRPFAEQVVACVERQLAALPAPETARQSLEANGLVVLVDSAQEALDLANEVAPEHLCLHDPAWIGQVRSAGSIFLGPTTPEAAGDYVTGPNHVLPTGGAARATGGLSVLHFLKVITCQRLSPAALERVAVSAAILARAEGLEAHARSIECRLRGGDADA
jgi:histidinol dehydrogenase